MLPLPRPRAERLDDKQLTLPRQSQEFTDRIA